MAESVAAMLLDAAREDAKAVRALSQLSEISDTILGFHAQQSIEKALRAVLSSSGVAFRRTHDIAELLDLISDHRLPSPPCSGLARVRCMPCKVPNSAGRFWTTRNEKRSTPFCACHRSNAKWCNK